MQGQGAISNYVSRTNISMQSNPGTARAGASQWERCRSCLWGPGPPSYWVQGRRGPAGQAASTGPGPVAYAVMTTRAVSQRLQGRPQERAAWPGSGRPRWAQVERLPVQGALAGAQELRC